jgi:hypothetical protein
MTLQKTWQITAQTITEGHIQYQTHDTDDLSTLKEQFPNADNLIAYGRRVLVEGGHLDDLKTPCTEILLLSDTAHQCLRNTWNSLERQSCAFAEGLKPLADEIAQCGMECRHDPMQIIYAKACL